MIQRLLSSVPIVCPLAFVLFLGPAASGKDKSEPFANTVPRRVPNRIPLRGLKDKSEPFANTVLLPRGMVADPRGDTGFVPNAGAIDAIDLRTGKVLWTTKAASRPLLVGGDQLVALAKVEGRKYTVRVVVLDASPKGKGKRVRDCQRIELSERLISRVPETRMHEGDLFLRWEATQHIPRGKFGVGRLVHWHLVRVNLASRRVDRLSGKDLPAPKLPREIASIKTDLYSYGEGYSSNKPVIVGDKVAVVIDPFFFGEKYLEQIAKVFGEKGEAIAKAALRRWDLTRGKELKPVTFRHSVGISVRVSPDKRYGFAPILRNDRYHWTVFSLETGKSVGRITTEGTSDMGVLGSRVYMSWGDEKGRDLLIALELKSGRTLWTLRLRDGR
jgi:hypothetical protein